MSDTFWRFRADRGAQSGWQVPQSLPCDQAGYQKWSWEGRDEEGIAWVKGHLDNNIKSPAYLKRNIALGAGGQKYAKRN